MDKYVDVRLENLYENSNELLLKLRNGEGFDEKLFSVFYNELEEVLNFYSSSESIPKLLANITSLVLPLMMCCEGIYHGNELLKLTNANEKLSNLILFFYDE